MTLKIIKGNLLDATEDLIIHGCNCFCNMNAGVAKALKEMWPDVYQADLNTKKGATNKLGSYSFSPVSLNQAVINAYTQYRYGRGKVHLDYSALKKVLDTINKEWPTSSIALPKIGCGLAGGDWKKVQPIIEKSLHSNEVTVYCL